MYFKIFFSCIILNSTILNAQNVKTPDKKTNGFMQGIPDNFKPPLMDVSNIKNKYLDISYASKSESQKLDIYLPEKFSEVLPVIVAIHGGAFLMGDKRDDQVNPMLEGLKRGYAIVSLNYRLSGEAKFPANINDIKAAIRWIKANAAKYNLNPDKIAVWGGSAGGNLASLTGTSAGVKDLEDLTLGNESFTSNVQAVVDWFGPTNFLKMDDQLRETGNGTPNHNNSDSPESLLLGAKITEIKQIVNKANPETYISKLSPSFFIEHGTKDGTVPTQQSVEFYNKLVKVIGKDKVTITLLEGASHGGPQFETKENLDLVFKFLDHVLKNNKPN